MKTLISLASTMIILLTGCSKTSNNKLYSGGWQLVERVSSVGNSGPVTTKPAANASVLLVLNADGTYSSKLNGQTICQGSYTITTDASYNNAQILQLNNFTTTGLFSLFTVNEVGTNGQVISSYDGMTMNITGGTLTLTSALTPGGYEYYTFIRN